MKDAPKTADGYPIRADVRCRVWAMSPDGRLMKCRVCEIRDGRLRLDSGDGSIFLDWQPTGTWMSKRAARRATRKRNHG